MNENEILDNIDNNNNNNNCKLSQINITTFIDKNKSFHSSTPINMNRKNNDYKQKISLKKGGESLITNQH